ncbi:hypothetical protein Hdeb2414_s0023g00627971 [Helianthus debilis subsp. tardiflorus]
MSFRLFSKTLHHKKENPNLLSLLSSRSTPLPRYISGPATSPALLHLRRHYISGATNSLLLADYRPLVHLFSCRCGPQTADLFLQKKQTAP